jgi:ABC-type iron transport system FetAB ATPase subunit
LNDLFVSKVEQVECELRKLSQAELRQIREWLDDIIEDNLQFTPEFEHSIQRSERDMATGKIARVREPEHD